MVDIAARASAKLEGENMRHGTMHSGSPTWVLTLNKYQRDNLLFLLNMCGYPGYDDGDRRYAGVEPFTIVHNGDWLGEIALMLSKPLPEGQFADQFTEGAETCLIDAGDHPNTTIEEVRKRVAEFLASHKQKATLDTPAKKD
jgi:hypothetical protein